jgi:hypothetical protein
VIAGSNTVTFGNRTIAGYPAAPGWDPVTGWGAPTRRCSCRCWPATPAPDRPRALPGGHTSPRFIAISRSSTRPPLTRSPSCSYSLVTHGFSPRIADAVRSDRSSGTYMSRK